MGKFFIATLKCFGYVYGFNKSSLVQWDPRVPGSCLIKVGENGVLISDNNLGSLPFLGVGLWFYYFSQHPLMCLYTCGKFSIELVHRIGITGSKCAV